MAASRRSSRQDSATFEVVSGSVEETRAFGERLGHALLAGDVVALSGELGSGKTTLIQGIARGLGRDSATIKSPTFVIMREYGGEVPLIHIDGYRLEGAPAAAWLDVDLLFSPEKITVIEWAERFASVLPDGRLDLQLTHLSTNRRRLAAQARGPRGEALLAQVRHTTTPVTEPSHEAAGD